MNPAISSLSTELEKLQVRSRPGQRDIYIDSAMWMTSSLGSREASEDGVSDFSSPVPAITSRVIAAVGFGEPLLLSSISLSRARRSSGMAPPGLCLWLSSTQFGHGELHLPILCGKPRGFSHSFSLWIRGLRAIRNSSRRRRM